MLRAAERTHEYFSIANLQNFFENLENVKKMLHTCESNIMNDILKLITFVRYWLNFQ